MSIVGIFSYGGAEAEFAEVLKEAVDLREQYQNKVG